VVNIFLICPADYLCKRYFFTTNSYFMKLEKNTIVSCYILWFYTL